MSKSIGFLGSIIKIFLVILNLLTFLIGATLFTITSLLRWSPEKILGKISTDKSFQSILNISALNNVSIVLLSIASLMVILSIIGLFGSLCANRFFLIVYEFFMIILFFTHIIALVIIATKSIDIEKEFRGSITNTMNKINEKNSTGNEFKESCELMRSFSELFKCCGANNSSDFINEYLIDECCIQRNQSLINVGCSNQVVTFVKSNAIQIVLVPNAIILIIELITILFVPFLINKIRRLKKISIEKTHNESYLMPTTDYYNRDYGSRH
jgi:hypothetical protein